MEISVKRMLRTRGALVAAITALAVGLTLIVGTALTTLVSLIPATSGLLDLEGYSPFEGFGIGVLVSVLPFVLGYFVSLWVVAPITEQLRIGHVITRSILATGIGATILFIVGALVRVIRILLSPDQSLVNSSVAATSPELIWVQLAYALQDALTGLVVLLPLGVLGGVLQWVWRTAHPAPHHIEGLIDV